jgi:hypothetical protein
MTLKQDEQRPFLLGKERESMVLTTGTMDSMTSPRKECKFYCTTKEGGEHMDEEDSEYMGSEGNERKEFS